MTRFQSLLKPTATSTPKEQQDRASQALAKAVTSSHLHWWSRDGSKPASGQYVLLAVAPYSQYDLSLLDLIDESLGSTVRPKVIVYVTNLLDYEKPEDLKADFPDVTQVLQTPVVTVGESGKPNESASGQEGRDLAARVLGLSADELTKNILARSPRYPSSSKH